MPIYRQSRRNGKMLRKAKSPKTEPRKKIENMNKWMISTETAIKNLPTDKNPRPDGITQEFYQIFRKEWPFVLKLQKNCRGKNTRKLSRWSCHYLNIRVCSLWKKKYLNWSIIDLQCVVNFRYTAKWFSYKYTLLLLFSC